MSTTTKVALISTLLTVLFAGQTAIAGKDNDHGVFATDADIAASQDKVRYPASAQNSNDSTINEKNRYSAPTLSSNDLIISGKK